MSKIAPPSAESMAPWLVAHTCRPIVIQSIPVANFDLLEVHPWLRLIERGGIHKEKVVFGPFKLITAFLKHVHATFGTEVSVRRLGILGVVALDFLL